MKGFVVFFVFLMSLSFAFASVGDFGAPNNPSWWSNDFQTTWSGYENFEFEEEFAFTAPNPNRFPVVCDIDEDGKDEVITYDSSNILIYGMDQNNEIQEEYVLSNVYINLTSQPSNTAETINDIACVDLSGDGQNKPLLIVHHGSVNGSAQVVIIEHEPDFVFDTPVTYSYLQTYGDGFYLHGVYDSMQSLGAGFSCSDVPDSGGWSSSGEYECAYGNTNEFTFFSTSAYVDSGDNQRFPIATSCSTDCVHHHDASMNMGVSTTVPGNMYQNRVMIVHGTSPTRNLWVSSENGQTYRKYLFDPTYISVTAQPDSMTNMYEYNMMGAMDITGSSLKEACFWGQVNSAGDGRIQCRSNDNSAVVHQFDTGASGGNDFLFSITGHDVDLDGDLELFYLEEVNTNQFAIRNYGSSITVPVATITENQHPGVISMTRLKEDTNVTLLFARQTIVYINLTDATYSSYDSTAETDGTTNKIFIDMNNVYETEVLAYDGGSGSAYIWQQVAVQSFGDTIALVNTTKVGDGYYGFYDGPMCNGTIDFSAIECGASSNQSCTYVSTVPTSQERICTTCGGTQPLTCGSYSYANPETMCNLSTPGNYSIDLSIESTSFLNYYQAVAQPDIVVEIIDGTSGLDCNLPSEFLITPDTGGADLNDNGIADSSPDDTDPIPTVGDGPTIIAPTADPTTNPVTYAFQLIFGNLPPAIQLFLAGIITIGTAVLVSNRSKGNPILTIVGALFGAGLCVVLTLITLELVIIVFAGFAIVAWVYFHFSRQGTQAVG